MPHPYYHSLSSVKKWKGRFEDYMPIHNWLDSSKESCPTYTHRAVYHHAEGVFLCEEKFGFTITNSDGKEVPVRAIAERHIREDCAGRLPTRAEWLMLIQPKTWMSKGYAISDEEGSRDD